MSLIRKASHTKNEVYEKKHRFEHWYVDNQVYFITSKTRDGLLAFVQPEARSVFWNRFEHYAHLHHFTPWVTTLVGNHYHTLGYLKYGPELAPMMRKLHGSVSKLINDLLPGRHTPFWPENGGRDYFDGCIRDELQCRRAFRYTLTQSVRHKLTTDWTTYPDTRVNVDLERGIERALELKAFMSGVPYPRYDRKKTER